MADTSDPDGIKSTVSGQESDEPACSLPASEADLSAPPSLPSLPPSLNSSPKRVTMEADGDGAPNTRTDSCSPRQADNKSAPPGDAGEPFGGEPPRARSASSRRPPPTDMTGGGVDIMKTSWDGSAVSTGSGKGEEPTEGGHTPQGYVVAFKARAGMLADPVKIAKEREKEERVRQARERLAEERKKKLEELREQQRIAQENREKQLEMRRKKIEDLRRRDVERRAAVEERRKMKEEIERARRESILQKAEERVARYEAWKAGGRKGGRGHVLGFGSATPRDICLPLGVGGRPRRSSSHSALQRLSPSGSDMLDSVRPQRRALSACSAVRRRHCCLDSSRMGLPSPTYQYSNRQPRPASMTASMPSPVRMRQSTGGMRKQRPASVASSMPSFVGGEAAKSPRSKSTDRAGRDRSKNRTHRRDDKASKDKENEATAAEEVPMDGDEKGQRRKVNKSFFDRLSTPKFHRASLEPKDPSPKKESPIVRRTSLREKPSPGKEVAAPSPAAQPDKANKTPTARSTPRSTPRASSASRTPRTTGHTPASPARASSPGRSGSPVVKGSNSGPSTPRVSPPPSVASVSAAEKVSEDGTTPTRSAPSQDITAEEYKARLAEKRRQARERAEKEAEEERKRLEEERLLEEERQRQEEDDQKRMEEESLRLAAEARKAEEERLQRAIEAEEKRKKEEAERMEQERKAKEEAERKAKEEAERLEQEKQERARREEEERLQRKKKLEMIMKRVKPDAATSSEGSPTKSLHSASPSHTPGHTSPTEEAAPPSELSAHQREAAPSPLPPPHLVVVESDGHQALPGSSAGSSEEEENEPASSSSQVVVRSASSGDILESGQASETSVSTPGGKQQDDTDGRPKFKSPLLQQLVEKKGGDAAGGGTPKFKSPLLQNLLGKTKVGARMGLSASTGDLSHGNKGEAGHTSSALSDTTPTPGEAAVSEDKPEVVPAPPSPANEGGVNSVSCDRVDDDQSDGVIDRSHKEISKAGLEEDKDEDTRSSSPLANGRLQDSALGASLGPPQAEVAGGAGTPTLHNGHHLPPPLHHTNGALDDSSISLHSVEGSPSVVSSPGCGPQEAGEAGQFEEIIDLLEGSKTAATPHSPIIAFDQSRRPDITESLS